MTVPILSAHTLHKSFPGPDGSVIPVLRAISLHVDPGELVAIVGPSGSGKSTLLYCLAGLEPYDSGSVLLDGEDLGGLKPKALARRRRERMGFVFQSFNLIGSLTARQNVSLPATLARRRLSAEAVDGALDSVGLADRAGHRPGNLSGGQQQRVAVARVLAMEPAVVFADEPTGALDSVASAVVLSLLRAVASRGSAVVLVTHDLEAAASADRVLVLRDGAIHRSLLAPSVEAVLAAVAAAGTEA